MVSVALAVTQDMSMFGVATPVEIFGLDRADLVNPWYDFRVCGPDTARIGGWFRSDVPRGFDELATADTVIVPACRTVEDPPSPELVDAVRAAYDAGARMVSICTGAFVLAAAGILDGRRATTHWLHAPELALRHPRVTVDPNVLYVDEGRVLTSAGKAAGLDRCRHLVRLDHGVAVANELARLLVMPPHRTGGQAQFISTPSAGSRDDLLGELFDWALGKLDQPLTVEDLARQANMSSRNLNRHFAAATGTTPLQWLHSQRIARARELLETSDESIDRIAGRTGMGTATTLRRHFNRSVGVPPDTYRRTFRSVTTRVSTASAARISSSSAGRSTPAAAAIG
jgi:transcriptional regulator GlxA family with amidase domain